VKEIKKLEQIAEERVKAGARGITIDSEDEALMLDEEVRQKL